MSLKQFELKELPTYIKAIKKLKKKFRNITSDVDNFFTNEVNCLDDLGVKLHDNIYKVRIKNSNKQAGKSSGYRLITYVEIKNNKINLLYIYDKSDFANISDKELDSLVIENFKQIFQNFPKTTQIDS
jgi:mRNA-degrading endonuclease RelE of RelBE toxin-antitoxin system